MPETLYSVTQVAELAKIPTETIYAWERRYDAITPNRTTSGRRVYTASDLARLKLLKACVEGGSRIGTIARLSDTSLQKLLQSSNKRSLEGDELVQGAHSLDLDEIETRLGIAFMSLGPAGFADGVLSPFMAEIAERWRVYEQAIATEHLVTTVAKSIMFSALRVGRIKISKPTALFATPEGEAHDIGLLAAAVAAQTCGVRSVYLGAQMPPSTLAGAAVVIAADMIVLSSSNLDPELVLEHVLHLRTAVPRIRILCGGKSFRAIPHDLPAGVRYFESVADFERMLLSDPLF